MNGYKTSNRRRYVAVLAVLLLGPAVRAPAQTEAVYRGKTAAAWAKDLQDKDVRVRWYATYALGQLGPRAAPAVPDLMKTLENRGEHEYIRGGAAWALGSIGPAAEPALPLLIETLASQHVSVRRNSTRALGRLGAKARPAVPGLLEMLEDDEFPVRANAAVALWRIEEHPKATAALRAMLQSEDATAAYLGAVGLGRLGANAEPAADALVAALGHADPDVPRAAARSLGRIGPKALPAVEKALQSPDENVRRRAVEALRQIGPVSVAALISSLKDESPIVKRASARALARLGPDAAEAESALLDAVNDPDRQVRDEAAKALGRVRGGDGKETAT